MNRSWGKCDVQTFGRTGIHKHRHERGDKVKSLYFFKINYINLKSKICTTMSLLLLASLFSKRGDYSRGWDTLIRDSQYTVLVNVMFIMMILTNLQMDYLFIDHY